MIVKDIEKTSQEVERISNEILKLMSKECDSFVESHDMAEQIYLLGHIVANVYIKTVLALEATAKIYNVKTMTSKYLINWINDIVQRSLKINKKH